jgi:ketosteroid isomerase-like protein
VSQRNVELVRTAYDAWNRGDVAWALEHLDPEVELHDPPEAPDAQIWHGQEGYLRQQEQYMAAWEHASFRADELVDAGDKVLVRVRSRGRTKNEGLELDAVVFHVFTLRDGKATAIEVYGDEAQALEAAGLDSAWESPIEVARRGYEFFNRTGGPDFDLLDPEIEWTEGADVPEPHVYHRHEGVRRQQEAFRAAWDSFHMEPEEFIELGDKLVVIIRIRGKGKASGAEVEARMAHVWQIRDRKAVRFEIFADPERALEAVAAGRAERRQ